MKMRVLLIAGLVGCIGLWAMQPQDQGTGQQPGAEQQPEPMVALVSADKEAFQIPMNVARQSLALSRMLDEVEVPEGEARIIPLDRIQADVLALIIDLMTQAVDEKTAEELFQYLQSKRLSDDVIKRLLMGLDFLDIQDVMYNAVGQYFAAQLMASFNDPNALSGKIREINNLTAILGLQNKRQLLSEITEQIKSQIPQDLYVKWEQEHVLQGHSNTVRFVAYSPDENHIVTGSDDGTARIWNAQTGVQEHVLQGHTNSAAYSPDGNHVVTGFGNGTARIWNAQTGAQGHLLQGHTHGINSVSYSPDENHIVTGSSDTTARIWNAQTGALEHLLQGHRNLVMSVAYSPSGNHIVTNSADGTARIWNAHTGELRHEFAGHFVLGPYSPDGNHIVAGSYKTVFVWNAETGVQEHELAGHNSVIWSVAYSPDGNHIVAGAQDGTARIWNAETGVQEHLLQGHTRGISSVAYLPDGNHIATVSDDGTARIWNAQTGAQEHELVVHDADQIWSIAYSPDGNHIVMGCHDGTVRIWQRVNLVENVDDFNQALLIYILTQKRAQNPNYGLMQLLAEYRWEGIEGNTIFIDNWAQETFNSLPENFQQFIQEKMPGRQEDEQPTTFMQRMMKRMRRNN